MCVALPNYMCMCVKDNFSNSTPEIYCMTSFSSENAGTMYFTLYVSRGFFCYWFTWCLLEYAQTYMSGLRIEELFILTVCADTSVACRQVGGPAAGVSNSTSHSLC